MRTSLRIDDKTLKALTLARGELVAATRRPIASHGDTVAALLAYWDANKKDTHAVNTPPVCKVQPN